MYEYSAGLTSIVTVRSSANKNIHTNYDHSFCFWESALILLRYTASSVSGQEEPISVL